MKREWTLYFAASTALLALYIASKFALDREAAGEAAQTSPSRLSSPARSSPFRLSFSRH